MRFSFLLIIFISFSVAANMQDSYNKAKEYRSILGNPSGSGIDKNADTSNLKNFRG